MKNIVEGIVIKAHKKSGQPNPYAFTIKDDNDNEYFAHLGDIEANEKLLYKHYKDDKTVKLDEHQRVKFEIFGNEQQKAIHVKKID